MVGVARHSSNACTSKGGDFHFIGKPGRRISETGSLRRPIQRNLPRDEVQDAFCR
jgi:hypothetical protein